VQVGSFSHDIFYGTIQKTSGFLIQIIYVQAFLEITDTLPKNSLLSYTFPRPIAEIGGLISADVLGKKYGKGEETCCLGN
jgi:hypothetical protein